MYIRTVPGGGGSSTSDFVSVSKSRIDPPQGLVARQRGEHRPELRAALAPCQHAAYRAEVAADRLQLAHDRLRRVPVQWAVAGEPQLAEALQRRPVRVRQRDAVARQLE